MDKAELGNKHICNSCGTKFYDLNKESTHMSKMRNRNNY